MTTTRTQPLSMIEAALALAPPDTSTRETGQVLARILAEPPGTNLGALARRIAAGPTTRRHEAARRLVNRRSETARLALIVVLRPELRREARRMSNAGIPRDDAEGLLVAAMLESLATAPTRRSACERLSALTSAINRTAWREVRRERNRQARHHPLDPERDERAEVVSDPAELVTTLLGDAVSAKATTPRRAELVWRAKVLGETTASLASALGVSREAIRKELSRGEADLRAYCSATCEVGR